MMLNKLAINKKYIEIGYKKSQRFKVMPDSTSDFRLQTIIC